MQHLSCIFWPTHQQFLFLYLLQLHYLICHDPRFSDFSRQWLSLHCAAEIAGDKVRIQSFALIIHHVHVVKPCLSIHAKAKRCVCLCIVQSTHTSRRDWTLWDKRSWTWYGWPCLTALLGVAAMLSLANTQCFLILMTFYFCLSGDSWCFLLYILWHKLHWAAHFRAHCPICHLVHLYYRSEESSQQRYTTIWRPTSVLSPLWDGSRLH